LPEYADPVIDWLDGGDGGGGMVGGRLFRSVRIETLETDQGALATSSSWLQSADDSCLASLVLCTTGLCTCAWVLRQGSLSRRLGPLESVPRRQLAGLVRDQPR
jgi:hypothetical protein